MEPIYARAMSRADPAFARATDSRIDVTGLFASKLGHAQAANLLARELEMGGFVVNPVDATAAVNADMEIAPPPTAAAASQLGVLVLNPEAMVHAFNRLGASRLPERRRIGYWVWELERAPARWRRLAGHVVHEIWAPSAFAAEALRAAFDQPVRVVPHASALAPLQLSAARRTAARAALDVGEDVFVAATSFAFTSSVARKNPDAAIAAFSAAFAGREDALLMIRCIQGRRFPGALTALKARVAAAGASVRLIEDGGIESMHDLYAACDAYISLHRSEGFGLNLAEAMLAERAVIATGWSGNLDFMDGDCAMLIPPRALVPVHDPQGVYKQRGARWAEPDMEAAIVALRALKDDPARRAALAAKGAAHARAVLSGGAAAQALRTPP